MHIASVMDGFSNRVSTRSDWLSASWRTRDFPWWIAAAVASSIVWWPLGLAVLGYLFWTGRLRMGCVQRGNMSWDEPRERYRQAREAWRAAHGGSEGRGRMRSSGNVAFDEYRAEAIEKLREEQRAFMEFLGRLRHAKDKAEFDQFLAERGNRSAPDAGTPSPA